MGIESHVDPAAMNSETSREVSETLQTLTRRLLLHKPSLLPPTPESAATSSATLSNNSNRAAVLICLFQGHQSDLRVILTKRASTLSAHPGEVALPGGKTEKNDADDVETALREAKEEIGLDPCLVHVVSVLDPFVNKKGMTVVPVVGLLHDKKAFNPDTCKGEVEEIFDAPLDMFLKDENRRQEEREWKGDKYLLHFFDYEAENKKYVIWALTAGILIKAASIVYQQPPAFSERRPKFWNGASL